MWRVVMIVIVILIATAIASEVVVAATELDQPTGCEIYNLGDQFVEKYSPSVDFTNSRSITIKLPKDSWEVFSIVFESLDGSPTGALQFRKNDSVILTLKNWDSSNIGPREASKILPPHISPSSFLKQWIKISLGRLQEVLTVRIDTLEAVTTFPEMDISPFQRLFAHVDPHQYIEVGFDCRDSQPPLKTSSSQGLVAGLILTICLCAVIVGVVFTKYKMRNKQRKKSDSDMEKATTDNESNGKNNEASYHLLRSTKNEEEKQEESLQNKPEDTRDVNSQDKYDSRTVKLQTENESQWKNNDKNTSLTTVEQERNLNNASQDICKSQFMSHSENGQSPTDNESKWNNDENNMKPGYTKDRDEKQEVMQKYNTPDMSVLQNTQDAEYTNHVPLETRQDTSDNLPKIPQTKLANKDIYQSEKTQPGYEAIKHISEIHTHPPNDVKGQAKKKTDYHVEDLSDMLGGLSIK